MATPIEWERTERFIEGEFEYTSQRMRDLFGLPPGFERDDIGRAFAVLKRGAGVDRIAYASARDQREDFRYLREHGLSTPLSDWNEYNDLNHELDQSGHLFGSSHTEYRFQFSSQRSGALLIVARLYSEGRSGDINFRLFNTTAVGRNGYVRELAVDVLRGDQLLATVDGNRTAEPIHIHLTGIEDFDNPWHYKDPPRLVDVISDSLKVAKDPAFLDISGKFARRE